MSIKKDHLLSADDVELAVLDALRAIEARAETIPDTDQAWTKAVKEIIARVGRARGYEVYASSCEEASDGEWLFDLTWMQCNNQRYMISLPLILESEWTPIEVVDDFCKLVVSRADHRVMVFWANESRTAEEKVGELVQEAQKYRSTDQGDRYLFAVWVERDDRFDLFLHIIGSGTLRLG